MACTKNDIVKEMASVIRNEILAHHSKPAAAIEALAAPILGYHF